MLKRRNILKVNKTGKDFFIIVILVKMNDEDMNSGELSGDDDNDALVFHILITEPLTKLK